jgi:chromosome segregation protein
MKLTKLRIAGFKSFVEPADFMILPGLTGVVGPNGCGKSNLVEALRWVMGESSHKNMRASNMDDVIFAGSHHRPARNFAEVTLTLDNSEREAPAAFNHADMLEITRKITRDEGSLYRVNSSETRARDVQLLFADAATGARSASLVRQNQISEMISAKPQARRRILEDAAGIAGLHSRRSEAEMRLKAASDNVLRVEDVLREISTQIDHLRRQDKQAARYKALSADIRRHETLTFIIQYRLNQLEVEAAQQQVKLDHQAVLDAAHLQAESAKQQAVAAYALPPLREAEAAAASRLQRLHHARNGLEAEERRSKERLGELQKRLAEISADRERQQSVIEDAGAVLARLEQEKAMLSSTATDFTAQIAEQEGLLQQREADLLAAESHLLDRQARFAEAKAQRMALERGVADEKERLARLVQDEARLMNEEDALKRDMNASNTLEILKQNQNQAQQALLEAEQVVEAARLTLQAAREAERQALAPLQLAEREAQRFETEAKTLARLFVADKGHSHKPVLEAIHVASGFETALGAALSDDLNAALEEGAPLFWRETHPVHEDPALPEGAVSLQQSVEAPFAVQRRLSQIGVVPREQGPLLQAQLKMGQRLVSREGDVWRWDGLTRIFDAPSSATRILIEKNRLQDVEKQADMSRKKAESLRADYDLLCAATRDFAAAESHHVNEVQSQRRALNGAQTAYHTYEKQAHEQALRITRLQDALAQSRFQADEARAQLNQKEAALEASPLLFDLEKQVLAQRAHVEEQRSVLVEARAALHQVRLQADRQAAETMRLKQDQISWGERQTKALQGLIELDQRYQKAQAEQAALLEAPDDFLIKRRHLLSEIESADQQRQAAADRLIEAETALARCDKAARMALEALALAREAKAGSQARMEALAHKSTALERAIIDQFDCHIADLMAQSGLKPDQPVPDLEAIEARLSELKRDRDRLGAVNLCAESELQESEAKLNVLAAERDDLNEAIKRLRQALFHLNKEGRERLLAAFEVVNGHFQTLFTTLFGGGTARLSLVDADDPLEAGLDIVAHPPGKKPQTMTLLSGGEQALTAIALIFAVFLTNPSPICVLDEVDAPLDDANVERYCDLLTQMARETETRFIVITHNPITMARMDRLFGVTMAERGVSQLVSVDLQQAETFLEAV